MNGRVAIFTCDLQIQDQLIFEEERMLGGKGEKEKEKMKRLRLVRLQFFVVGK